MQDDSLLRIVVGQRMVMELDNVELSQLVVLGLDKEYMGKLCDKVCVTALGQCEIESTAVLQMVPCMERDMTDFQMLLPFVHAIHPFDAELPVGQVYMSFYSAAVVTKHDVGDETRYWLKAGDF